MTFHPLTPDRWADLEKLFGPRGASAGCWCMWWRVPRKQFVKHQGDGNKRAFRRLVAKGQVCGVLAYHQGQPVGWCAVEPREVYPVLGRSRILKPVDDQPVWSVTCFFVRKDFRRKGITVELLKAAIRYARKNGAKIVEGYPVEAKKGRMPDVFAYTGLAPAFRKAGFVEVARRSPTRPIMRA